MNPEHPLEPIDGTYPPDRSDSDEQLWVEMTNREGVLVAAGTGRIERDRLDIDTYVHITGAAQHIGVYRGLEPIYAGPIGTRALKRGDRFIGHYYLPLSSADTNTIYQ